MSALAPTDLLAWLEGEWSVDRAINGREHAFTGTARFTREDASRMRWAETGHLVLDAYSGPASRTLFLVRDGAGGLDVRFVDDRPFHTLQLTSGHCDATHPCGEDLYRGTYAVESDDALRVVWHVDGPRKRDVIESLYRRRA
ncbi:MAG TPA: DUF6314 family protein [Baekduia sp.]|uniref:DUF6314 family protein n=1 Tax=Baekduia sp. TaxID=2600305 RepID=UPI002D77EFA6|nr:DUF6314 family protein [Baekduia sp.]HET6510308.1 DUF6314 family protein [Baekduia sp.]